MTSKRDECMARLAAADVYLRDARSSIELVQALFCDPSDDQDGASRAEEMETAFMSCHLAAVSLSKAQAAFKDMDEDDVITAEDDNDDEEEEGEEDGLEDDQDGQEAEEA